MSHPQPLSLLLALALGCGDTQASGAGGNEPPREVADVAIDSGPLVGTRIGQRWALTATALDTFGESIGEVDFDWDSSDVSVAEVDADGLVTALGTGVARISATAKGYSSSVELSASSAVPSDVGEMYTTWFPRSDQAPVAIIDGRLEVFGIYPGAAQPTRPWPHPGVERFQWAGDRLAILTDLVDGMGTLRVLDRHQEWSILRVADAMGFQLAGDRIAELGAGGSLRVKDGELRVKDGIQGPGTTLERWVTKVALSGDRIGVLRNDGVAKAKDGIHGEWTLLASSYVEDLQVDGDRISMLFEGGDLRAKDCPKRASGSSRRAAVSFSLGVGGGVRRGVG